MSHPGEEQRTGQHPPWGPPLGLSLMRGMTCYLLLMGKLRLVAFNSYPFNQYKSLATLKIYPLSAFFPYQNCCLFFLSLQGVSRRAWGEQEGSLQQLEGTQGRDDESSGAIFTLRQTFRTFTWLAFCQLCSPCGFR